MASYNDKEFKRAFRMSRSDFNDLELAIGSKMSFNAIQGKNLSCQFDKWSTVCTVAALLHNYCREAMPDS